MSVFAKGQTNVTLYFRAWNVSDGTPRYDVAFDDTGLEIVYVREREDDVAAAEGGSPAPVSLAAANSAHTDWGIRRVVDNLYRVDFPDTMCEVGDAKYVLPLVLLDGVAFVLEPTTDLTALDPRDSEIGDDVSQLRRTLCLRGGLIGDTGNDATHLHLPFLDGADDVYNGTLVTVRDDDGESWPRYIADWVAATKLATLNEALPFTPADDVDECWLHGTKAGAGIDASAVADAVLDEAMAGHVSTGTLGKAIADILTNSAIPDATRRAIAQETLFTLYGHRGHRIYLNGSNVRVTDTDGSTTVVEQPFARLADAANPVSSVG